jgi:hypothetical protein
VPPPPGAHLGQKRHELDRRFGEAVDRLLTVTRVVAPGQEAGLDETLQPVRQDVRGDPLFRAPEHFPEAPTIAEHDVADDDQAPAIAQHFQREVDRAA